MKNKFTCPLVLVAAIVAFFWVSFSFSAMSEGEVRVKFFDLPGQSLQSGLIEFAIQADVTVVVESDLIQGYRTSPVIGPYSVEVALNHLLSNSPLALTYLDDLQAYVINLRVTETAAQLVDPDVLELKLEETLVLGSQYPFRYNTVTSTQMDGDIAYFDSSRYLNVTPKQLISDQNPRELAEILQYSSGISLGDGLSNSNDDVFIRGFQRDAIYLDGFRLGRATGMKILPAAIEQVEVLKGPSTLRFGQSEPGGVVNVVRKKPVDIDQVQLAAQYGSFARTELSADVNVVSAAGALKYRVVVADNKQDESGGYEDLAQSYFSLSSSWRVGGGTTIDAAYSYQHSEQVWNRDFQVLDPLDGYPDGVSLAALSSLWQPQFESDFSLFDVTISHYFESGWRLQSKLFVSGEDRYGVRTSVGSLVNNSFLYNKSELGNDFILLVPGGQIAIPIVFSGNSNERYSIGKVRSSYYNESFDSSYQFNTRLEGEVDSGSIVHHVSLGVDWLQKTVREKSVIEVRDIFPAQSWPVSALSLQFPRIVDEVSDVSRPTGSLETYESDFSFIDYGFYLQDSVELTESWVMSLGARYSVVSGEYKNISDESEAALKTHDNVSTQLGLVYKPNSFYSVFSSYSEAFRANYNVDDIGGVPLAPESSNQYELGVKSIILDGGLLSSLSIYEINKKNIVDIDTVKGIRTSLHSYEQRVQGLDVDITAELTDLVSVVGAFSVLDARITSGYRLGNVPKMSAGENFSLFVRYQMFDDLDFRFGANYLGERYADDENKIKIDAFQTYDLISSYELKYQEVDVTFEASIKNITDEHYFRSVVGNVRINESEGRSVSMGLKVSF